MDSQDEEDEDRVRSLTRQLAETAVGVREMSKQLGEYLVWELWLLKKEGEREIWVGGRGIEGWRKRE